MPALVVKSTLCVSVSRSQMKYFAVHCMYICVVSNITTIKLLRYYDGSKKKKKTVRGKEEKKIIFEPPLAPPGTGATYRRHDKVTTEYCIYNIILLCFIIPPVQISSGLAVAAGTRS